MIAASKLPTAGSGVRLRSIALPVEHGGWSLLFEPIVLGLLLAPSIAGVFVSLAATATFLARHPFKLLVTDRRRGRETRRTELAQRFAIAYAFIGILSFSLAFRTAGAALFIPLLIGAAIAIVQLWHDFWGQSRALVAELAGSISTGSVAAAIAICGGWPRPAAFALWIIIAGRSVPTILYLRARLRLLRHKPASARLAIGIHVLAVFVIVGLAWNGLVPWLSVLAVAVLLVRASIGLLSTSRITPQRLGVSELLFGGMTVAIVSLGYAFRW